MKRPIIFFVTALVALLSASSAGAVTVALSSSYAGQPLSVGDTVSVVLTLDADVTGIQLMGMNVVVEDGVLGYNPQPNANVGVPSYILYNSGGMPMVALYAQQDPWQTWPAPDPGELQVNVNWADSTFAGTQLTDSGIKIAELEYEVLSVAGGTTDIVLTEERGGGVLQVNGVVVPYTFSGTPITLNLPEPSVGMLSLGAILSVAILRRRAQRD